MGNNHAPGCAKPKLRLWRIRVAQNERRRGGSSRSLGRNAALMSRCSLGRKQFAAGDDVAGPKRNPRTLFTSRLSERQESCDCAFARFQLASASVLPTIQELSLNTTPFVGLGIVRKIVEDAKQITIKIRGIELVQLPRLLLCLRNDSCFGALPPLVQRVHLFLTAEIEPRSTRGRHCHEVL
jgi:hypothetical protein